MGRYYSFIITIYNVFKNINTINGWTTLISFFSIIILMLPKLLPKYIPKWIPIPLILIILITLLSHYLKFNNIGISIVGGNVPSGFPPLILPNIKYIFKVIPGSIIISLVSYMGSIALAKGFEQKILDKYKDNSNNIDSNSDNISLVPIKLNANKEFIAYGITNVLSSFFKSFVVSGSFGRSALNMDMEGHTQISSIIQGIFSMMSLLFLMPLLKSLPKCVLAAIVISALYNLIKNGINEFKFLWNISRKELIEFSISFIVPLIIGLEYGIIIAIASSILVNIFITSNTKVIELGQYISQYNNNDNNKYDSNINDNNNNNINTGSIDKNTVIVNINNISYLPIEHFNINLKPKRIDNIIIFELQAQLTWTNSEILVNNIKLLCQNNKYIILCMSRTQFIDSSALRDIINLCNDIKNVIITITCMRQPLKNMLDRYKLIYEKEFPTNLKMGITIHDTVIQYKQLMKSD